MRRYVIAIVLAAFAAPRLALAADDDVARAVDAGNARFIAAYAHDDADALAAVYDPDGARFGSSGNGSITRGRAAIAAGATQFLQAVDGPVRVTIVTQRLYVMDGLAYEEGRYTFDFTARKDGKRRHDAGHYVTVWRHQADGGWAIYADMDVPE